MSASVDDYRWLVSEEARPWLERVGDEARGAGGTSVTLLQQIRRHLSAARAHLLIEQVELRQRAGEKFRLAERMFFTRKGLEQASDEVVAAYKAARFAPRSPLADLCCGIGGDLMACGRCGPSVGVELDPVTAVLAAANCGATSLPFVTRVEVAGAREFDVGAVAAWHIDPDRRSQGKRTTRVEQYEPPLETIQSLLSANANAAIKLAPAAKSPLAWRESAELEWLGSRGECRQQVAWFGSLARHPGRRSATIVDSAGGARTVVGAADEPIPPAAFLGRYLYEPHAAILAATLTGSLCRGHNLSAVSPGIAYLTSDKRIADSALATFEVREVLPLDQKQLKAWCREHGVGRLEVKKRGVDVDPERLRKAIVGTGDAAATLIIAPMAGKIRVAVAERVISRTEYRWLKFDRPIERRHR